MNPSVDRGSLFLGPGATIREAIRAIDVNEKGIVLVVAADGRLAGTVTDGDIRRALLAGVNLEAPLARILARKTGSAAAKPVTAPADTAPETLLALMREKAIHQVPLLGPDEQVAGLVTLDDLLATDQTSVRAVIMAGGEGRRLRPFTEDVPKPMLEVGGRPMLEHIITGLRDSGIRQMSISTNYLGHKIEEYFRDGSALNVSLDYVNEPRPLGTAGSLRLVRPTREIMLVINGDVLTGLNYRAMLQFHREHDAAITVAVRKYDVEVPYGVVVADDVLVRGIEEKPCYFFLVNAGIYLVEPSAQELIPANERFDMTDLISVVLAKGMRVVSFPLHEYWIDVGRPADYSQAQEDYRGGKLTKA